MLSPSDAICASWTSVTCPSGYSTTTRVVGHAVERLRDRAARVAGGGDENRQRRAVGEVVQQPRLHPGADVLERAASGRERAPAPRSRSVTWTSGIGKSSASLHQRPRVLLGDLAGSRCAPTIVPMSTMSGRAQRAPERSGGSGSKRSGKVQAAIRRRAGKQRVDKRHGRRRPPGPDPLHGRMLWRLTSWAGSSDRTGPWSSTATSTTSASVTLTTLAMAIASGRPGADPHRSASTDTRTVMEVRPTRTVSV